MRKSAEQIKELIESLEGTVSEYKELILENAKEIAKEVKKKEVDVARIGRLNDTGASYYQNMVEYQRRLKKERYELVEAKKIEEVGVYQEILDFLNEMYIEDLKFYQAVRDLYLSDYKEFKTLNKATQTIGRMDVDSAEIFFRNDLTVRYLKLVAKLKDKVGKVEDVQLRRNNNKQFDGFVTGEKGTITFHTIIAGGYNIQRAHYRTVFSWYMGKEFT